MTDFAALLAQAGDVAKPRAPKLTGLVNGVVIDAEVSTTKAGKPKILIEWRITDASGAKQKLKQHLVIDPDVSWQIRRSANIVQAITGVDPVNLSLEQTAEALLDARASLNVSYPDDAQYPNITVVSE